MVFLAHRVCRDHKGFVDHRGPWANLANLVLSEAEVSEGTEAHGENLVHLVLLDRRERKVNVVNLESADR